MAPAFLIFFLVLLPFILLLLFVLRLMQKAAQEKNTETHERPDIQVLNQDESTSGSTSSSRNSSVRLVNHNSQTLKPKQRHPGAPERSQASKLKPSDVPAFARFSGTLGNARLQPGLRAAPPSNKFQMPARPREKILLSQPIHPEVFEQYRHKTRSRRWSTETQAGFNPKQDSYELYKAQNAKMEAEIATLRGRLGLPARARSIQVLKGWNGAAAVCFDPVEDMRDFEKARTGRLRADVEELKLMLMMV